MAHDGSAGPTAKTDEVGLRNLIHRFARGRRKILLEDRLRFETLLSELSAGLIHAPAGEIDVALQRALQQVVTFLGVDRGNLDEYVEGGRVVRIAWALPGLEEPPVVMDVDRVPWTSQRLARGDVVRFSRPDELPGAAALDRATFEHAGTRSTVLLPLRAGGPMLGVLSFGSVRAERAWPDDLVGRLRLLSEAFASALQRRRMELEAQRLRQDLTHIGRVSALGELSASLAHELSQPLTAILSNAQAAQRFLAADVVDLEKVREILDDIVADDKRAGAVIHRLRALLKKGDLDFVLLDVNDIVGEVAWLVRSDAIVRDASMSLELAADLPSVRGDRVQLQQAVLNLVLNGLEAMREPHADPRALVIRTARDGPSAVRVAVEDSGPGIDDKDLGHVFEPLYTTKAEGLGMGLAIVRTIVDAHGGSLGAANNARGGATVHFTLPVSAEDTR
jgi:signal transduction histidine kinase